MENYPSTANRQYVLFVTFQNIAEILGLDMARLEVMLLERSRGSDDAYELITGKQLPHCRGG